MNDHDQDDDLISMIKVCTDATAIQNILIPYFKRSSNELLAKINQQDPLKTLDPELYSIGYLYILFARGQILGFDSILEDCVKFLSVFNVKMVSMFASVIFKQFLAWICDSANTTNRSFLAIDILCSTLKRYNDFGLTLTPIHAIFVKQCFVAKAYKEAQFLLDQDMEIFDKNNGITYLDHLLYHFYGAILYVKLKIFHRALHFLRIVISAPTLNTSAIQVNAYKKFVILSLIVNGKIEPVPHITDIVCIKSYKVFGKAYDIFAEAYEHQDHDEIKNLYFKYRDIFIKDKNNELIKYAIKFLSYHEIYRLRKIYTSLSIVDINRKIGPWNGISLESQDSYNLTEEFVLKMINEGKLNAFITNYESQKIVNFVDTVDNRKVQREILEAELKSVSAMMAKLIALNHSYGLNKMHLAFQSNISAQNTFYDNDTNSIGESSTFSKHS
ncbi:uncharacterized protein T551_01221 [Pneumocystis jirovecii RU7]|uniref:COP9 signalosome complex subunit 3 N-terminal helical repeats domain-containing protein n=1 Tax=Pneumocystis jirovecii (strain RU7) TaxID=1408657 RepID=A0A0W4ZS13_PNEJ7|nr:uncharacterized protein T551_01221 [Pneumocystis jirovecii RU7]KTW31148.1 hypothetical protein T551_01221 [Pneumocystis jirovecii RU7]